MYQTRVVKNQQFELQQNITDTYEAFDDIITEEFQRSLDAVPQVNQDDWRAIANFDACYLGFVNVIANVENGNGSLAANEDDIDVPPPGGNQGHAVDGLPQGRTHNSQEHNCHEVPFINHQENQAPPPDSGQEVIYIDKTRAQEPVVKLEDHGHQGGADDPIYVNELDALAAEVKLENSADQRRADDPLPQEDDHISQDDQNIPIVHQQGDQAPPAMAHNGQLEGIPAEAQAQDPIDFDILGEDVPHAVAAAETAAILTLYLTLDQKQNQEQCPNPAMLLDRLLENLDFQGLLQN